MTPLEQRIAEIITYIGEHPSKDVEFDARKIAKELRVLVWKEDMDGCKTQK